VVGFADEQRLPFTVGAVYDRADVAGDYLITRAAWAPHHIQDKDTLVAIDFKDGVSTAAGEAAVQKAVAPFGSPDVRARRESPRPRRPVSTASSRSSTPCWRSRC
jgi:putative ABC transport system permease protein